MVVRYWPPWTIRLVKMTTCSTCWFIEAFMMANIPLSAGSVPPRHFHWQKWVMTDYIPVIDQPIHLYQDRYQMRIGWIWQAFGRMSFSRDSHLQSHTWSFRLWFGGHLRNQDAAGESPPSGAAERVPSCGLYSCSSSRNIRLRVTACLRLCHRRA